MEAPFKCEISFNNTIKQTKKLFTLPDVTDANEEYHRRHWPKPYIEKGYV